MSVVRLRMLCGSRLASWKVKKPMSLQGYQDGYHAHARGQHTE